ncbi:hypothetical protein MKW98_021132 [Papaver atlanticum]|uniref:AP2/ERF domain-containing protein n=1 Tax=Papaver atlanticum TaxID=357466 RepID=A0AAD4T9K3_9MAGN|nr:hypothetical protein MKW98_021132 [Papaver atlanticum]
MEEQGMLSMESNITTLNGVVGEEGCSDSNGNSPGGSSNNHQRKDISVTSSAKLKGVVWQTNGRWGAQIYANHMRIWIGTFKSKYEAGKAYDAAAIKLRSEDSHRNYPSNSTITSLELDFQKPLIPDEVLSMLKDGSYNTKLYEFVNSCSLKLDKEPGLSLSSESAKDEAVPYQKLFQEELTPSDVGKLNKLEIPKRYAEKYFPEVSKEENDEGVIDDTQLSFDRELKSSESCNAFTRGWNRFVKDKKLRATMLIRFISASVIKSIKRFT